MKNFEMSNIGTRGKVLAHFSYGGLTVAEVRHAPEIRLEEHAHVFAGIVIVIRGCYCERFDGKRSHHPPGTVLVKPARHLHENRFDACGSLVVYVEVEPKFFVQLFGEEAPLRQANRIVGAMSAPSMRDLVRNLRDGQVAVVMASAVDLLSAVLARRRIASPRGPEPSWFQGAMLRLSTSGATAGTIDTIASAIGINRSHMSRVFQRMLGCSASEFVQMCRFEEALEMVHSTNLPLATIASQAGFCDQSHMSRSFKKYAGTSPSQLRRNGAAQHLS